MRKPNNAPVYEDIELKLGIKSSVPNAKKAIAMLVLLWYCENKPSKIDYCVQDGDIIALNDSLFRSLYDMLENMHLQRKISIDDFLNVVNSNPMLVTQLEPLVVAFEVVWKLAKIKFTDGRSASSERTGNKRYPKTVIYTSKLDEFDMICQQNKDAYILTLFNWLGLNVAKDDVSETNIIRFLTISAENAFFKLINGSKEIVFNLESLYDVLLTGESVDICNTAENKGPMRILRSGIEEGLFDNLVIDGDVITVKDREKLSSYADRVIASHQIVSRNPNTISLLGKNRNKTIIETLWDICESEENKKFAFKCIDIMRDCHLLTYDNISFMCDANRCKNIGHPTVPILKLYDASLGEEQANDKDGHPRYYSDRCNINDSDYLVTKEWYKEGRGDNRGKFVRWIIDLLKESGWSVSTIKSYIESKGFRYSSDIIDNFYLSLKTKPFVILAGISGTGKTKLVKLFAEAIKAEYKMIPVRPDWSDSTDLFGHTDLSGEKFIAGEMLDFIKKAKEDRERPYILCLDEMNLARVEHYFSDVLSIIETRKFDENGSIKSAELIGDSVLGKDKSAKEDYARICLPENLYIVGTVNMDETTFQFSKKVLDRANTIEFNEVDLSPLDNSVAAEGVAPIEQSNGFLKSKYITLKECPNSELVKDVCSKLQEVNGILAKYNAHVGYRVRDEIVFYMLYNAESGLLAEKQAFDNALMQKILPRIQGSNGGVKQMLCELFDYCTESQGNIAQKAKGNSDVSGEIDALLETATSDEGKSAIKYPKSAKKIASMVRSFESDGFTTFWI